MNIISKLGEISKYGGLEDSAFSPTLLSATRLSTDLIPKELPAIPGSLLEEGLHLPIELAQ